ncbi:hypothetical protein COTS27_00742 [Spirochaetota bacterium]|nr:hypothetical protein COTS27_00742 [Spirochaetota bacterium]
MVRIVQIVQIVEMARMVRNSKSSSRKPNKARSRSPLKSGASALKNQRHHSLKKQQEPLAQKIPFLFKLTSYKKNRRPPIEKTTPNEDAEVNEIQTLIDLIKNILPVVSKRIREIDWREFSISIIRDHKVAKLFSILASLFIFFYMKGQDITEKNLLIPLNIVKNQDLSIANKIPDDITVFVSGTKDVLLNLDVNRMYAEIDITTDGEGTYVYKPILKGFTDNIQVLRTSPTEIEVTISALERKLIEVIPELIGAPHPDYYLVRYSVKPRRLWVTGPNEILSDVTTIQTEPISIENIKSNKEINVLLNKSVHPLINVDRTKQFSVFLYLRSKFVTETIEGTFLVETGLPKGILYTLDRPSVRKISFEVLEDFVEDFDAYESFSFFVRTDNIKAPGQYKLDIEVEAITGIRFKNFFPKTTVLEVRSSARSIIKESSAPTTPTDKSSAKNN